MLGWVRLSYFRLRLARLGSGPSWESAEITCIVVYSSSSYSLTSYHTSRYLPPLVPPRAGRQLGPSTAVRGQAGEQGGGLGELICPDLLRSGLTCPSIQVLRSS